MEKYAWKRISDLLLMNQGTSQAGLLWSFLLLFWPWGGHVTGALQRKGDEGTVILGSTEALQKEILVPMTTSGTEGRRKQDGTCCYTTLFCTWDTYVLRAKL